MFGTLAEAITRTSPDICIHLISDRTNEIANLEDAPSRYVSRVYTQAREVEAAYATWKDLLKDGKVEEAREFREDNADAVKKYGVVERIKKRESELSARA
jgi:hypothetical protein